MFYKCFLYYTYCIDFCGFWTRVQMYFIPGSQLKGLKVTIPEEGGFRAQTGGCYTPPDGQQGPFKVIG